MLRITLTLSFLLLAACSGSAQSDAAGIIFTVTGYDAQAHHYTVNMVNHIDKTHVRYTVVCDCYSWGSHKPNTDETACDIQVGDKYVPDIFNKKQSKYSTVEAWVSDGKFVIQHGLKGQGGSVLEQFTVLKATALKYGSSSN